MQAGLMQHYGNSFHSLIQMKDIQLIWTCDSSLQFEKKWILGFLGSRIASQISVSIDHQNLVLSFLLQSLLSLV